MTNTESAGMLKPKSLALVAALVLLGLVLRTAWVTEDAYITLRTVDNWVHGFGLRWNVDERVQSYTHPLWMFVLSAFYFVTREAFYTTIFASIVVTSLALALLVRMSRSGGHALVGIVLLLASRSFVEFSTSGLENPLSHLLLGAFLWLYLERESSLRSIACVAALLALNRADTILFTLPALAHAAYVTFRAHGGRRASIDLAIGFSPLLAWEAFSLVYYGSLVPNTAYAKLNTGVPTLDLAEQGVGYLLGFVGWDAPGAVAICAGLAVAMMQRRLRPALAALGVILYLAYVVRIGGDFMLGRFLTLPLFAAVCMVALSPLRLEEPIHAAAAALPMLLLFLHPNATEHYSATGDIGLTGIADERQYYRDNLSLAAFSRTRRLPFHGWAEEGRELKVRNERTSVRTSVGLVGFYAGPTVHLIDAFALCDPLLARLPAKSDPKWRIGHFERQIPAGYEETIKTGECKMQDAKLCEYYAHVRAVTAGPIFSWSRWKSIVGLQFRAYDGLIDQSRYRFPDVTRSTLTALGTPVPDGALWNAQGTVQFKPSGVEVQFEQVSHAARITMKLDANDGYVAELRRNGSTMAAVPLASLSVANMRERSLDVPAAARDHGFDALFLWPTSGDGLYSIGEVRLVEGH